MRKQGRSAAVVATALLGAGSLAVTLLHPALAQENEDRTNSTEYTASRADYWAAREAWAAKKTAQAAGEEVPAEETAVVAAAAATEPAATGSAEPVASSSDAYPTDAQLYALRVCESSNDYTANTGNGYYGAYQFSPVTWWWIGYSGYPHHAAPAVQDQAVRDLYALQGWYPWPSCARYLGFL